MKKLLCAFLCLAPLVVVAGCGGTVEEEAPPSETPELTAEEQTNMEAEMKKAMEQQGIQNNN